jgi:hypothetical protein
MVNSAVRMPSVFTVVPFAARKERVVDESYELKDEGKIERLDPVSIRNSTVLLSG